MGMYDGMAYSDLQREAKDRQLAATGTTAELIARLEQADVELLTRLEQSPADPPAAPTPPPPPEFDLGETPAPAPGPTGTTAEVVAHEYKVAFPCPHDLSDGLHEEFRQRAYNQAIQKGHIPRGGLGPVARTGWATVNGMRHAVYAVPIRS